MKQKYYIGFFVAVFLFASLIGIGYQMSYRYAMDKRLAKEQVQAEELPLEKEESVTTKGAAEKNEGYYLCELQGYVVVYLGDQKTIYEMTEIPVGILPETVREEVKAGKFVETARELYGLLENYSS